MLTILSCCCHLNFDILILIIEIDKLFIAHSTVFYELGKCSIIKFIQANSMAKMASDAVSANIAE